MSGARRVVLVIAIVAALLQLAIIVSGRGFSWVLTLLVCALAGVNAYLWRRDEAVRAVQEADELEEDEP
jgi:hypothetical protein